MNCDGSVEDVQARSTIWRARDHSIFITTDHTFASGLEARIDSLYIKKAAVFWSHLISLIDYY